MSKIADALERLRDIGFEPTLREEAYESIEAAGFDVRTLHKSFALAQILEREQPITVRGAFYRAVSAGIYLDTGDKLYRQVQSIILKLRRAGLVPYSWIADSTRLRLKPSSWSGLQDYGETVRECYRKDFWAEQKEYVEVVCEKDAMSGVLRPVTEEFDIHLSIIRGNCSETFLWSIAEMWSDIEKPIVVYYLGDHDVNGLDIERDLKTRLAGFVIDRKAEEVGMHREDFRRALAWGSLTKKELGRFKRMGHERQNEFMADLLETFLPFRWHRLAITSDDFSRGDLLGFPVRQNDSKAWGKRCREYIARHGDRCIEVDAIPANEIRTRLRHAIESHIDVVAWDRLKAVEEAERETIVKAFRKVA